MRIAVFSTGCRPIASTAVLLVGLVACGSDEESGAPPDASNSVQDASAADVGDSVGGAVDAGEPGDGTATLTMVDGVIYTFEMSVCETSNTDDFVLPDSYDLAGTTADGAFRFSLARAGLDETFITQVGVLEGDFDDAGSNAAWLYNADLDDEPLSVDGAIVSGTFLMDAVGPPGPHGDQIGVILDARC